MMASQRLSAWCAAGAFLIVAVGAGVGVGAEDEPARIQAEAEGAPEAEARAGEVRVALLRYGGERKNAVCFADTFIRTLEYETDIKVDREFVDVGLEDSALFDFPFAIMTGEGRFSLSGTEVENLRRYISGGGFVLASAGCSNSKWADSMREQIRRVFPESELMELPLEHDVFHTVFDIMEFESKKARRTIRIEGIEIDGRLAVVFSPEGLNDTKNAGEGCCCCGGNEILNAKFVNANIMAYALMR